MSRDRKPNQPFFRPDAIQEVVESNRQSMVERPGDGPTMTTDGEPSDDRD